MYLSIVIYEKNEITYTKARRIEWIRQTSRMKSNRIPKVILDSKLDCKIRIDKPKIRLIIDAENDLKETLNALLNGAWVMSYKKISLKC